MQAFVYFAGRGVQYDGDNYFVPVDAQIARDSDVPIEAVKLSDFTHALAADAGPRAHRRARRARAPNPYAQPGQPLAGGLALVDPEAGDAHRLQRRAGLDRRRRRRAYGVYAKTLAGRDAPGRR